MEKPEFNLRRAKNKRRAIDHLRSLSEDCAGLRPSDIDGMGEDEIHGFLSNFKQASAKGWHKVAVHGHGDTWTQVGLDYSPYSTSPLVNTPPPDDRNRRLPGGGANNTNSDSDTDKNTMNDGDGSTPHLQRLRIDQMLEETQGPEYIVRKRLLEHEEPSEEAAKKMFGGDGQTDGKSVFVVIRGFDSAMEIQRKIPGATIEPMGVDHA